MAQLADPLTLRTGLTVRNRIVKAAMTENLADHENQPTEALRRLYARWARGGAGLLVTGNLMVDRRFLERSRNVVADDHLDVSRLAAVRESTGDTPLLAQLNHPGRQTNRFVAWRPVAPSAGDAVPMLGLFGRPRALSVSEVEDVVAGFGRATALAVEAGLEGVQVHAAHGYLLAQFLSPRVNTRSDRYGGAVADRARALLDSVRAARAASAGTAVTVKLNSSDFRRGGLTEDDAEQVVRLLVEEGVDLVEVSGGTYEDPALLGLESGDLRSDRGEHEAYFASFAERARRAAPDVPVMLTGGIRTRSAMTRLLASGSVDLIGLGRPLAIDPDLPTRLLQGHEGGPLPSYDLPTVVGMAGESEWYEAQIRRMGAGEEPDPDLSAVRAASTFVVGEAVRGLGGRRRRAGLVATAARS